MNRPRDVLSDEGFQKMKAVFEGLYPEIVGRIGSVRLMVSKYVPKNTWLGLDARGKVIVVGTVEEGHPADARAQASASHLADVPDGGTTPPQAIAPLRGEGKGEHHG